MSSRSSFSREASLGGISALQIGLGYPDRFAQVLALSPVLGDSALAAHLAATWRRADPAGLAAFLIDFDDDPLGRAWLASVLAATATPERHTVLLQTRAPATPSRRGPSASSPRSPACSPRRAFGRSES